MKKILLALVVFLVSFFSFTHSLRFFPTTDSIPNNFVAMNLIFENRIDLTNYKELIDEGGLAGIKVTNENGIVFSKSPPLVGLLSTPPFYLVNKYFGIDYLTETQIFNSAYHQYAGKITASLYTSLSVIFVFLILSRFSKGHAKPLLMTAIYVFCTNIFNTASQANTMHGVSLFLIMLYVWILLSAKNKLFPFLVAGLIAGLFTQVRISNVLYLFFPFALIVAKSGITKELFKKMFVIGLGFALTYGFITLWYRELGVPYGLESEMSYSLTTWGLEKFIRNVISILFSFNFGLFFYSPLLLLGVLGAWKIARRREERTEEELFLTAILPVAILFVAFASSWWMWIGGGALNARLLSESVPIYIFLTSYSLKYINRKIAKILVATTFVFSFYLNFLTTYQLEWAWWANLLPGEIMYNRNAWFHDPILAQYMLENNYIYVNNVYRKNNEVIERIRVYRPSFVQKGIPKLFDNEKVLITLDER